MSDPTDKRDRVPEGARTKKELWFMIAMIVLAVLMVCVAAATLLYNRWFQKPSLPPNLAEPGAPSVTMPPVESGELPSETEKPVGSRRKSEDIYTILVFGSDQVSGLTDTMMVVTYDVTNQRASVMSIPRDTLVNVRGSNKQLNAVYKSYRDSAQGLEALKNEVSNLVGFTPDYYVKIDWDLVGEMVEAIGGVWYDIPYHMDYDDPYQDLHIHFDKGSQFLNGEDAMKVVRWRKNNKWSRYAKEGGGGDTTRLGVQQGFLKAVLKQTLQIQNLTKITQLAELFGRRVESDLTVENLLWFGKSAIFGGLEVDDVNFFTMPHIGVYQGTYKDRVYPNQDELLAVINEHLNPYVEEVTIDKLDLIQVSKDGNALSSSTGVLAGARP